MSQEFKEFVPDKLFRIVDETKSWWMAIVDNALSKGQ
jgi:hypothetical protein